MKLLFKADLLFQLTACINLAIKYTVWLKIYEKIIPNKKVSILLENSKIDFQNFSPMPKTPRKAHCWSSLELLGRGVHLTSVPFSLPFLPSFLCHWDVPKTVTIVMRGHKSLWSMYTQSIINTWQGEELSTVILTWGLCISLLINPQFWALCRSRNTKLQAPFRQAHKIKPIV